MAGELIAQHGERAFDGLPGVTLSRGVPVDVIDDGRVERLLLLEERRDDAPNGGGEAAAPSGAGRWRDDLPQRVERDDLMFVEGRRGMRKAVRKLLNRAIEPGQRLVVLAVGRVALGFE